MWHIYTYRFIFHGRTGHTPIQLAVIHYAGFYQGLDRHLVLEQEEAVTWNRENAISGLIHLNQD